MADSMSVRALYSFDVRGLQNLERALKFLEGIAAAAERIPEAIRGVSTAFASMGSVASAESDRGVAGLNRMTAAADRTAAALRRVNDSSRPGDGNGGSGRSGGSATSKFLGGAGTVAGVASAVTLVSGVRAAADNQAAIARIAAMTGRSPSSISRDFMPIALSAANRTGMSVVDALGITQSVAGIIKDPKELRASLGGQRGSGGILDVVSVLKRNGASGSGPDIARELATADHILNAYTGASMAKVNDKLYRFLITSGASLPQAVTQMGYFGEQYRLAGGNRPQSIDDILAAVQLGIAGIGHGKWGAGFGQILRSASHPSPAVAKALTQLGVLNPRGGFSATTADRSGQFTPFAMFAEAARRTSGMTPMGRQALINALPASAARVFAEALSPKTTAFLARSAAAQSKLPSLMGTEAGQMKQLYAQTDRLKENFRQLSAVVAGPLLGPLSRFVGGAANNMSNARTYLSNHPTVQAATTATAVVGSALVSAKLLDLIGIHGPNKAMGAIGRGVMNPRVGRALLDTVTMRGTRDAIGGVVQRAGSAALNSSRVGPAFGQGLDFLTRIGSVFARMAPELGRVGEIVLRLGLSFSKFGTRAIPFVGEVLLIGDAIRTLGAHSKNIGEVIGHVAAWMVKTGGPLLESAVKSIWSAVVKDTLDILGTLLRGIVDTVKGIFNGGHGGLFDFVHSVFDNAVKTYEADTATNHPGRPRALHQTTVHNTYHMHGEPAAREVRKAIGDGRLQNALVGAAPVSHLIPPVQSIGIGTGFH